MAVESESEGKGGESCTKPKKKLPGAVYFLFGGSEHGMKNEEINFLLAVHTSYYDFLFTIPSGNVGGLDVNGDALSIVSCAVLTYAETKALNEAYVDGRIFFRWLKPTKFPE